MQGAGGRGRQPLGYLITAIPWDAYSPSQNMAFVHRTPGFLNPAALWAMSRLDPPGVPNPIPLNLYSNIPQSLKGEVYLSLLSLSRGSGGQAQKSPWTFLASKM